MTASSYIDLTSEWIIHWSKMWPVFLFHPEGDPGQRAVDAKDIGGDGEMRRRTSPPSGSGGEPAGLLQSQTAPAATWGAGTSHRATGQAAGGRAWSLNATTHRKK